MIDVSDAFKEAWLNGKQKHIQLAFSDGTAIMDDDIVAESFSLTQALCDEPQLVFGLTSSAEFRIQIFNTGKQFKGLYVTPTLYVNVDETQYSLAIGSYLIDEDTRSDDRLYRTLTGHDALYNVLNEDYSAWYKTLSAMTIKEFRDAFFTHVGITQEFEVLANDNLTINIKSEVSSLSGAEIIKCICEPNACFGFINYAGHFQYVQPSVGGRHFPADDLYPSNDLYPGDGANIIMDMSDVESAPVMGGLVYSDYYTHKITQAKFVYSENTPEVIGGVAGNCYQFEDNILMYGQSASALSTIVTNFLSATDGFFYTPSRVKGRARIWAELGDMLGVDGGYDSVRFPVLRRYMSGITALYDEYSAQGTEFYTYSANSVYQRLTDVETGVSENSGDIEDINGEIEEIHDDIEGVVIDFGRTIDGLEAKVAGSQKEWDTTGYTVTAFGYDTPTAEGFAPADYTNQYYLNQTNGYLYYSNGSAWTFVKSCSSIQVALQSQITVNAGNINLKVSKNDVINQINISHEAISIDGSKVNISGNTTFTATQNTANSAYSTASSASNSVTNLSNGLYNGTTTINGGCIITGTIDASKVNVTNLSADSITSGTLRAVSITNGGQISTTGIDARSITAATITQTGGMFSDQVVSGIKEEGASSSEVVTCVRWLSKSGPAITWQRAKIKGASDVRMKEDIQDLSDISDIYNRLRPVEFKYHHDLYGYDRYKHYGLIAQELEETIDSSENLYLVHKVDIEDNTFNEAFVTCDTSYYLINYEDLHAWHIQMIQKQQRKIEELEERISVLEGGN